MLELSIQNAFIVCMLMMSLIGAYCAFKLDSDHPCWVRWIVLAPAIAGMFAPVLIMQGVYVPYLFDVIFTLVVTLLYALVASRFSNTPWLDIRVNKKG